MFLLFSSPNHFSFRHGTFLHAKTPVNVNTVDIVQSDLFWSVCVWGEVGSLKNGSAWRTKQCRKLNLGP